MNDPLPPIPVVLVQLDNFKGTSFEAGLERVVPICPISTDVRLNGVRFVRKQLPLRIAKATTIHKAQGQSLSSVAINPRYVTARGMAYVAVGRAKVYDRLFVLGSPFPKTAFDSAKNVDVSREYERLREKSIIRD